MNRIQESYKQIEEFERMAGNVNLGSSDLQKFTELMSHPDCGALRLFLAIGREQSPTAQWMADYKYRYRPDHNCYKNDSFCIAQHFGLDEVRKKESGLWVVENGMGGYYEPVTHGGFRLSDLLHQMGAMDYPVFGEGYIALSHDRIRKIVDKLGINNKELANSAENVINWCLGEAYKVEGAKSTFSASTYININQAEELARVYLPEERQRTLDSLFDEARRNMQDREKVSTFSIQQKSRV